MNFDQGSMLGPLQQGEPLTLDCKVQVADKNYHQMLILRCQFNFIIVNDQMSIYFHFLFAGWCALSKGGLVQGFHYDWCAKLKSS